MWRFLIYKIPEHVWEGSRVQVMSFFWSHVGSEGHTNYGVVVLQAYVC